MNKHLKILSLEDNVVDAELIRRELKRSGLDFEFQVVGTKSSFLEALDKYQPDVILSDHALPSFSSLEALALVKQKELDLPFILITGSVSERFAMECISAGVDDYILKQSLTRLPNAILNTYLKKKAERERTINFIKLQEANQELKTFIYRASHDIRGPICSLKGLVNISKMENEKANMEQLMNYIDQGVSRLDSVLLDLLGTLQLKDTNVFAETVRPAELVEEVFDEQRRHIDGRIQLELKDNFNASIITDKSILKLVLRNIIDNSIRFFDPKKKDPYVKVTLNETNSGLSITVSDNGCGIKDELCHRAFEMFFRANEHHSGNGLGLYLSKIGVEKLEGRIELDSRAGVGTNVLLFIPKLTTVAGIKLSDMQNNAN